MRRAPTAPRLLKQVITPGESQRGIKTNDTEKHTAADFNATQQGLALPPPPLSLSVRREQKVPP